MRKRRQRAPLIILAGCSGIFICLLCAGALAIAGTLFVARQSIAGIDSWPTRAVAAQDLVEASPSPSPTPSPTDSAPTERPSPSSTPTTPTTPSTPTTPPPLKPEPLFDLQPPSDIDQELAGPQASMHLTRLLEANYPVRDYFESAARLSREDLGQRTVAAQPMAIGDRRTFITDEGRVEAELMAVTARTYFWVETSLGLEQAEVVEAAQRFEQDYYPVLVSLFGEEWSPGVDSDPHFSVLHRDGFAEDTELGYFDSGDEFPQTVISASNEQEIIYLNMEAMDIGDDLYFGTLVHEVQHLVQWHNDGNETAWLNEALSQLAELYVGFDTVDTAVDYLANPGVQLNTWDTEDGDDLYVHYGAAYLFAVYLWEQLGDAAIGDLARHPANGMAAVQAILSRYRPDSNLAEFAGDWAVANLLDGESDEPGTFYHRLQLQRPSFATEVKDLPFETVRKISQFASHYTEIELSGETTVTFAGDTRLQLIPTTPHSDQQMWFVPSVDELDAWLVAEFDLSDLDRATLEFWTWYDLEVDFDFAYVSISTDGGSSWRLLVPEHAAPGEFGPAFNGRSDSEPNHVDGWIQESISLNSYVGRPVLIRFDVLTDSAVTGAGFALDDISVPELGYFTDVETLGESWRGDGFVQSGSIIPQQWSLHLVQNGPTPHVIPLHLNERNQGQWSVDLDRRGGVLIITAASPFTTNPASYWLQVEQ